MVARTVTRAAAGSVLTVVVIDHPCDGALKGPGIRFAGAYRIDTILV